MRGSRNSAEPSERQPSALKKVVDAVIA